eukprot:Skav223763  [mRNA]  locus=scaffold521:21495:24043:+ [translate_table: standard]
MPSLKAGTAVMPMGFNSTAGRSFRGKEDAQMGLLSWYRWVRLRQDSAMEDDPMQTEDPQHVSEYVKDIYAHMFAVEGSFQPRPHYLTEQREINAKMRAILIDWLVESDNRAMKQSSVDWFMALPGLHEIYPPEVKDFVYITDNAYAKDDILNMEATVMTRFPLSHWWVINTWRSNINCCLMISTVSFVKDW